MGDCYVELWWMPVGAGTSKAQRASLWLWEALEALRCRRPRAKLYHSALKFSPGSGEHNTLEVTPSFIGEPAPPIVTGPVGFRGADRWRLFRYQLRCLPGADLPDEQWAAEHRLLTDDCDAVRRLQALMPTVPRHTWGRRARGTKEMWTSDSTISWLLVRTGIDVADLKPPAGGRAPGWGAGIQLARR